jgi:hypothetical protein
MSTNRLQYLDNWVKQAVYHATDILPLWRFWNSSSSTTHCGMYSAWNTSIKCSQVHSWCEISQFAWICCHQSQLGSLNRKVANFTFCRFVYCSVWKISSIYSTHCLAYLSSSASPKKVGGWNFRNRSRATSSPRDGLCSDKYYKILAILPKACPIVTSVGLSWDGSYSGPNSWVASEVECSLVSMILSPPELFYDGSLSYAWVPSSCLSHS